MPRLEIIIKNLLEEGTQKAINKASIYVYCGGYDIRKVGAIWYFVNPLTKELFVKDTATMIYSQQTLRFVARAIKESVQEKGPTISIREALRGSYAMKHGVGLTGHWSRAWNTDVAPVLAKLGFEGNIKAELSDGFDGLPDLGAEIGRISYPRKTGTPSQKICYTIAELSVEGKTSKDRNGLYKRLSRLLETVGPEKRASYKNIIAWALKKEYG